MLLTFPNQSRSYDGVHDRIRFVGYDGVFEIDLSVEIEALAKTTKNLPRNEAGYLAAFDKARDAIERMAQIAYSRKQNTMIVLTATDVH